MSFGTPKVCVCVSMNLAPNKFLACLFCLSRSIEAKKNVEIQRNSEVRAVLVEWRNCFAGHISSRFLEPRFWTRRRKRRRVLHSIFSNAPSLNLRAFECSALFGSSDSFWHCCQECRTGQRSGGSRHKCVRLARAHGQLPVR